MNPCSSVLCRGHSGTRSESQKQGLPFTPSKLKNRARKHARSRLFGEGRTAACRPFRRLFAGPGRMHPTLSLHNNPLCVDKILAFKQCHEDVGYWGRLTGACNEQKYLLEKCFKAQKKVIRKGLLEKARAERQRFKQACEEQGL